MTELRHVMATATTAATAATVAAAANPVVPPRDHEHDDDTGTPTHRTVSYRAAVALPHPPTPGHEAGRGGDAAACRGCPTYVPSDEPHTNFLPPPDDRLVAELSSAELHEVRKDSERMRARYDHLLQVRCAAVHACPNPANTFAPCLPSKSTDSTPTHPHRTWDMFWTVRPHTSPIATHCTCLPVLSQHH
jgi:hypothetical protein